MDGSNNFASFELAGDIWNRRGLVQPGTSVRFDDYSWILARCGERDGGAGGGGAAAAADADEDTSPKYKLVLVVYAFSVISQGPPLASVNGVWWYPEPEYLSRIDFEIATDALTSGEPLNNVQAQHFEYSNLVFPVTCDGKGCGGDHRKFGHCVIWTCPPLSVPLEAVALEYPFVTKQVANMANSEKRCCLYFYYHSTFYRIHGGGDRHRLPQCIEIAVRKAFPNPLGVPYKGFLDEY